MNKKMFFGLFLIAGLVTITATGSVCLAQSAGTETLQISGKILTVDVDRNLLVIEVPGTSAQETEEVTINVAATTSIEKAGGLVQLSQLMEGDQVDVLYVFNDAGEKVAQDVVVKNE